MLLGNSANLASNLRYHSLVEKFIEKFNTSFRLFKNKAEMTHSCITTTVLSAIEKASENCLDDILHDSSQYDITDHSNNASEMSLNNFV